VVRTQRQKRMERLKERRQQQLAQIKKSLPGGKIDTNPRRVYYMIAAVALVVIIVIAVFAVLRFNGILH
jgi:cell division protein FtsI/penicillin-binding protein 2